MPSHAPRPDPRAGWRSVMGSLLSGADAEAGSAEKLTPMGLQFELRALEPRSHDRWRGPTSATAAPDDADDTGTRDATGTRATDLDPDDLADALATRPPRRLGVRPVVRSASGSYVKANITWGSFTHQVNRLGLDPAHHRWFAQFAALHRATRPETLPPETDWVTLDEFASPLLWELLAEADMLGIELVTSSRGGAVEVRTEPEATITLDARRDAEATAGSAVVLHPLVTPGVAGDPDGSPAHNAGPLGDHGVYLYRLTKRPLIVLARLAHPLTTEERGLLGRAPLRVPPADTAQFFDEYYPELQRGVAVTSGDASVALPEIPPPLLVLAARFRANDVLQLDWDWAGHRDPQAEQRILAELAIELDAVLTRFPPTVDPLSPSLTLRGVDAAAFAEKALPLLDARDDVRVDVIGTRPAYREIEGHPEVTLTAVETLKRDWFDLGFVVNINGYVVPFGPLFKALAKGQKKLLMVDKSYLSLDHPAFDRLRELLDEADALHEWETGPRVSRHRLATIPAFDDLTEQSPEAAAWRAAVAALRDENAEVPATPVPATIRAELRPYQKAGFDWLALLWRHGLGGVLADDMGLGKTLQTLALIAHARQEATSAAAADAAAPPFLVVAPTSVVANWAAEAARFAPGLVVRTVTATEKASRPLADLARGADVVVTSYALFRLDARAYGRLPWAALVLDEAQFVKNHLSKLHAAARELDVPFTLAITGTPLENDLLELWALFDLVAPGLFPSATRFAEKFQRPIERGISPAALDTLRRRIRPFLLRRTKDQVAPELPEKQEQLLEVELAPAHRHLYDTVLQRERRKLFGLIDDLDRNRFIVFRSLTLLRLLALDASLIDEGHTNIPSSKLDALVEHLGEVLAEGHRALVFSQFTGYLGKVAERLTTEGIRFEYLDGSTTRRPEVIARFREGDAPVFLISLKAGGFGLTLTEADYVYLLDPWWNPASENQAIDRTHRIGQTHPVNVYRLVASGTIEEKVMALKEHKAKLFDAVLDDDELFSRALTADDIRALLD
ncbi:DEAD/DEAH box helicase [Herbiconiux sp. KACC 21604]|uniref:DEAD/DEAH box helicase n=1 Tax=unclassified Herbiconiux TaxID=2618217 RepID=UPI00149147EA|nr:DEAD/DEAH box helicase [Herbiconiux sp. SALV-R1]QJU55796.1 DEAD/DEAH box helicase [Herbiconiux sp. SALV-R1]WPO87008.1 DEAD/DEAH box helicase [Herbiconiux sp. KACC 21604]